MENRQKFGVLVLRDDGQWGLLTTLDPHDFDRGNFETAILRAEYAARKSMIDWIWNARVLKKTELAVIEFEKEDKWKIIKFV
jgi:hypothetical protein